MAAKKKAAPAKAAAKPVKVKKEKQAAPKAAKPAPVKASAEKQGYPKDLTAGVGRVWAIADEISKKTRQPAKRADVLVATAAEDIPASTASTQYGRWRKHHGLTGRL